MGGRVSIHITTGLEDSAIQQTEKYFENRAETLQPWKNPRSHCCPQPLWLTKSDGSRREYILRTFGADSRYLFTFNDLVPAFPELSRDGIKMLLQRAQANGRILRVCKGVYINTLVNYHRGLVLYHTAALVRRRHLVYLSLESALSDYGIISQVPLGRITLMTSGRSGLLNCGTWGQASELVR